MTDPINLDHPTYDIADALDYINSAHDYITRQLTFATENNGYLSDDDTDYCTACANLINDLTAAIYDDDSNYISRALHALANCSDDFSTYFPTMGTRCIHDAAIPFAADDIRPICRHDTD